MFNGKMIARNGIEIHENDKLRAVYLENEQFGNDIILVGPGGFEGYPDVILYLELKEFMAGNTYYSDYEMIVYGQKEENIYNVLLFEGNLSRCTGHICFFFHRIMRCNLRRNPNHASTFCIHKNPL